MNKVMKTQSNDNIEVTAINGGVTVSINNNPIFLDRFEIQRFITLLNTVSSFRNVTPY